MSGNPAVTLRADERVMRKIIRASTGWEPVIFVAALSIGSCVGASMAAVISLVV